MRPALHAAATVGAFAVGMMAPAYRARPATPTDGVAVALVEAALPALLAVAAGWLLWRGRAPPSPGLLRAAALAVGVAWAGAMVALHLLAESFCVFLCTTPHPAMAWTYGATSGAMAGLALYTGGALHLHRSPRHRVRFAAAFALLLFLALDGSPYRSVFLGLGRGLPDAARLLVYAAPALLGAAAAAWLLLARGPPQGRRAALAAASLAAAGAAAWTLWGILPAARPLWGSLLLEGGLLVVALAAAVALAGARRPAAQAPADVAP